MRFIFSGLKSTILDRHLYFTFKKIHPSKFRAIALNENTQLCLTFFSHNGRETAYILKKKKKNRGRRIGPGRCVPTRYIRDNDEFAERGGGGALMERRMDTLPRSPE